MATIDSTYLGDLRTEATHLQSGTKIITDAPTDNQGKGEAFSPTDLLAESLAYGLLQGGENREQFVAGQVQVHRGSPWCFNRTLLFADESAFYRAASLQDRLAHIS